MPAIALALIRANPGQPRKHFDAKLLDELADSIRENGLLQPITVRPVADGRYEIVAGERRFRAHQRLVERGFADFADVVANVVEMDDVTRDVNAIIENLQRADIRPLEEANAFQRILETGMSAKELAKKLGISQPWRITDRVALLKLTPEIQKLLDTGNLSLEFANHVCLVPEAKQAVLLKMINSGQINGTKAIRAAVEAIKQELSQTDIFGDSAPKASEAEICTVNAMETKIETIARLASAGWKDGECIVATKVSRDRARLMADKLMATRTGLLTMERELRAVAVQAEIALAA